MEDEEVAVGRTIKKKFFMALGASTLLFGILLGITGFTGTVFAMPLGGMGDFYVTFDKLEGEGFELNPQIGETGDVDEAPLIRNTIDQATIENLHIYKDLKMPIGGWVRFNIKASEPTEIQGLIQDARFIDANLGFDDLGIKQRNTSDMTAEETFQQNWRHDADTVTITDAEIVTDYLFQNMVALNGAKISVEDIDGPDQTNMVNDDNESTNDLAFADSDGGDEGDSGQIPKTATNVLLPVVIGLGLILIGCVVLLVGKGFVKGIKNNANS